MKATNSFEIVGIGNFKTITIKPKSTEYIRVTAEGKAVKKKLKEDGKKAIYCWVDDDNKEYSDEQIFWDIKGKLVQKICRTEKIRVYEVVDKSEVDDFMKDSYYILDGDETTKLNFKKEVKENQALKVVYKKSSVGVEFYGGYIYNHSGEIMMVTGKGKISDGIAEYQKQKKSVKKVAVIKDIVEVKADELDIEI